MALVNNAYTLFAAINGATVNEQMPPLLEEQQLPLSGAWTWSAEILSGNFAPGTSFGFDYDVGMSNPSHLLARMTFVIPAWTDTSGGFPALINGVIRITLTGPAPGDQETRDVNISLRTIAYTAFTLFENQSTGAPLLPTFDSGSYTFDAPPNTPAIPGSPTYRTGIPDDLEIDFTSKGGMSVANPGSAAFTENGEFAISIQQGTRPVSYILNLPLRLRQLTYGAFTLFQDQTAGENLVPVSDSQSYTFTAPTGSGGPGSPPWRSGIPNDLAIGFTGKGGMSITSPGSATFAENGEFTVAIQDGSRPLCYLQHQPLRLRRLHYSAFTLFENQTLGDAILPPADSQSYTFGAPTGSGGPGSPPWRSGIPNDLAIGFTGKGGMSIASPGSATFSEDGAFTISVKDGSRPMCYLQNQPLRLRRLDYSAFTLFQDQTYGDALLPAGDSGTYTFGAPANTPAPGAPTFRTGIPNDLTVGFTGKGGMSIGAPGSATFDETGEFTISIQDGSRPTCYLQNRPLHLRRLDFGAYTLFRSQTLGDGLLPASDAGSYTFEAPHNDGAPPGTPIWRNGIPDSLRINFTSKGGMSVGVPGTAAWNEDGQFTLSIKNGSHPRCYLQNQPLRLRRLDFEHFSLFDRQHDSESPLPPSDAGSYTFEAPDNLSAPPGTPTWRSGISDEIPILFTNKGRMSLGPLPGGTTPPGVTWTESGTFTISIKDGVRPKCFLQGIPLRLRRFNCSSINVPYTTEETTLAVYGNLGDHWDWRSISSDLGVSEFNMVPGSDPDQATITSSVFEPGEHGNASVDLQLTDLVATPLAPASLVALPIATELGLRVTGAAGTTTLPPGRAKMRYQAVFEVIDTAMPDPGTEYAWSVDFAGGPLDGVLAFANDVTTAYDNILETPFTPGVGSTYLPNLPGEQTFTVSVVKRDASTHDPLTGTGAVTFTLEIVETKDNVNVTALLDHSSSMRSQHRWKAAAAGAGEFAILVAGAVGGTHKLGLYWFNSGSPATGPFMSPAGSYAIDTGIALTDAANVGTVLAGKMPTGTTSLGKGLLLCREELLNIDTGNEERVILLLSDGMENRNPKTTEIFFDASSPDFWGNPNIRIYPLALMTNDNWVDRLGAVVMQTGGLPALDVKSIPLWTDDTPHKIANWFITMFTQLFGYTQTLTPPDPKLAKNRTERYNVEVNTGQTRLVFYLTHHEPEPKEWGFEVLLPNDEGVITMASAKTAEGIDAFETPMGKMIVVDFPVMIEGKEHVWAGDWQMCVKRLGDGTGHYGVGAIVKQDIGFDVEILANAKPVPGDRVEIRVQLIDPRCKPIKDATVEAVITEPAIWLGDYLTKAARRTPEVFNKLGRAKSQAALDVEASADKLLQHLIPTSKVTAGAVRTVPLTHEKNGLYTGSFEITKPGEYNIDVVARGTRVPATGEAALKRDIVLQAAVKNLDLKRDVLSKGELLSYKRRAITSILDTVRKPQTFRVETRKTLKSGFVPDTNETVHFGFMSDEKTICMHVEPRDKDGRALGPGWAEAIRFYTPLGIGKEWPATDMLDGTYEVEIPLDISEPALRTSDNALVGRRLSLTHPAVKKGLPLKDGKLSLGKFTVIVMGVKMSIQVFALIGNRKTKEVHLFTCRYADAIPDENIEWFTDLKEIKAHKFDTCEICMPLICNVSTMEAHKPLCSHVRRIKPSNRREIHSLSVAKKEGFDGCRYCLPKHHTR